MIVKLTIYIFYMSLIFSIMGCVTTPQKLITLEHDVVSNLEFELPIKKEKDELLVYILNDATDDSQIYFNQNGSNRVPLNHGEFTYIKLKKGFNSIQFNNHDFGKMDYHACFNSEKDIVFLARGNIDEKYEGIADWAAKNSVTLHSLALNTQYLTVGGVSQSSLNVSNAAFVASLLSPRPERYKYVEIPFGVGVSNLNKFKYKEVLSPSSTTPDIRYIDIISDCNAEVMVTKPLTIREKPKDEKSLLTFVFTEKHTFNGGYKNGEEQLYTIWDKNGLVAHFDQEYSFFQRELEEGKHYFYLSDESAYFDRLEVNVKKGKHYMVKIKPSSFYKTIPLDLNKKNSYIFDNGKLIEASSKKVLQHVSLLEGNNPVIDRVNGNIIPLMMEKIGDLETGKEKAEIILPDSFGKSFD